MASAAQIHALQGMTGPALLDAGARVVGFPWLPSKITEPIDLARPQRLDPACDDWASAADMVDENIKELDRSSMRVLDNWTGDSAKGFFDYVTELIEVVEAQHTALQRLTEPLDKIRQAIEDAQRGVEEARTAATTAMVAAVSAGVAGAVALPPSAGLRHAVTAGAATSCVRAIVETLTSYTSACLAIRRDLEETMQAASEEMDALAARVSQDNIRQVTAPAPPRFSHDGFHSVNEPDDIIDL